MMSVAGGMSGSEALPAVGAQPDNATAPVVRSDSYVLDSSPREVSPDLKGVAASDALEKILARYGGDAIMQAEIGPAPGDFEPTDGSVPVPEAFKNGAWAYFDVSVPSESPSAIRAIWEADLVTGALRDAMHANGELLYSARTALVLPGGKLAQDASGGIGDVAPNQDFPTPELTSIASTISGALQQEGAHVEAITVLLADQAAPALIVRAADPASWVEKADSIIASAFGDPPRYEGYYIEVRDNSGDPFFIQSTAFRTGAGHLWVRPGLDPRS
jgi:hypothetical protein